MGEPSVGGPSVLQLLGPSTGGIRRHVAQLTTELERRGWQVGVAGPPGVMAGVGHQDLAVGAPGWPVTSLVRARRALTTRLRPGDRRAGLAPVDLIHAHGLKAGWLASTLRPRPPLVVTAHNVVLGTAAGRSAPLLRRLESRLPSRVDRVIAVSADVAGRTGGRAVVIPPVGPPPVPDRTPEAVRSALGVPPEAPLVVTVARLHPQKDLPTFLRAMTGLPDVWGAIVGEGPLLHDLRRLAGELGVAARVVFAGPSANAADELAAADVVVVSSAWESGPLVVAEALQLGRPVVSTPVGFVPALVDDVGGWVVPVGDDRALAGAVAEVLADPEEAAARADEGGRRVREHLGLERLVGEVEQVYDEVLGR